MLLAAVLLVCGLSPLARGTQLLSATRTDAIRFIPAGAGNTDNVEWFLNELAVYPRWRGEHLGQYRPCHPDRGLSPLARGTL